MAQVYEPKTVMGWVFGIAGAVMTIPIAVAKGGFDALQGQGFLDGAAGVCEASGELGAEFGDKYGGKILTRVVSGILLGIGADLDIFHHHD